ncbi:hypothetical protein ACIQCJ_35485 [Streptomyces sp. NPDC093221]|uniref:hypothetical protein n=1 Tax=Streptomyces sp. NPDC093221 TaxID=3366032 RepID=UPI0037FF1CEE
MTLEEPLASSPEKTRVKMWVEYPTRTRLSKSRTAGGYSSLARDVETNDLETHATLFPIDDEDEAGSIQDPPPVFVYVTDERASDSRDDERLELEEIIELLELVYTIAKWVERVAPHARVWWNQQALPVMKSTWGRVARVRRDGSLSTVVAADAAVESSAEEPRVDMSSAEARERLVAALKARQFSDEQLRVLRNARIEGDAEPLELRSAMGDRALVQLRNEIRLMIETHPEALSEEMPLKELMSRYSLQRLSIGALKKR